MRTPSVVLLLIFMSSLVCAEGLLPEKLLPRASWSIGQSERPVATAAWQTFLQATPAMQIIDWDRRFPAPHRAIGSYQLAGGKIADAADLEARLRAFVAENPELLAISVQQLEREYIAQHGKVWYAHFRQNLAGLALLHAEVTFRVSTSGRIILLGSDALVDPHVHGVVLTREQAESQLRRLIQSNQELQITHHGLMGLPEWQSDTRQWEVLPIWPMTAASSDGHQVQRVLLSAIDGTVLESTSQIRHITLSGTVDVAVEPREPGETLAEWPLAHNWITVAGQSTVTDADGNFSVETEADGPWAITGQYRGNFANVNREDGTDHNFDLLMMANGEELLLDTGQIQERDSYVHTTYVHDFIKNMDDTFTGLDEDLPVNINIGQTCNAFWNGSSINFFQAGGGCPNTGQVAGVVYHEYGHGINDRQYSQAGAPFGLENGAMHEGLADVTAIYLQDESFVAPGWNIRNLDNNWRYPENEQGQVHADGRIIGGAMYDLRQLMNLEDVRVLYHMARWGRPDDPELGRAFFEYFVEVLIQDDDNGDLSDLTPNYEQIDEAFNLHGIGSDLAWGAAQFQPLEASLIVPPDEAVQLQFILEVSIFVAVDSVELFWRVDGDTEFNQISMTENGGLWNAEIPAQASNTWIEYYAAVYSGEEVRKASPQNAPESLHRMFFGFGSIQRYDFEEESLAESADWPWEWGTPQNGPDEAWSGDKVWGTNLTGNYGDMMDSGLILPARNVLGNGPVAVQFMHWHNIESGWDGANLEISVNGDEWQSVTPVGGYDFVTPDNSARPGTACFTGIRDDWTQVSFDLGSQVAAGDQVALRFNLITDTAVTAAGWFIDDLELLGFAGDSDFIHTPLPDTEDTSQDEFVVTAELPAGITPDEVVLEYRVDDGATQSLQMDNVTANVWSETIPGPFNEQTIYYRMEASNAQGYFSMEPPFEGQWHSFLVGEDREDPSISWLRGPAQLVGSSAYWYLQADARDNLAVAEVQLWSRTDAADWEQVGELFEQENGIWDGVLDLESVTTDFEFKAVAVDAGSLANTGETDLEQISPASELHDGFEGPDLSHWQADEGWQLNSQIVYEGSQALSFGVPGDIPEGVSASMEFVQYFDLRELNGQDIEVSFNLLMNIEDGDDFLYLEASSGESNEWTTLLALTGFIGGWAEQSVFLSDYNGIADVRLRFRVFTDGNTDNGTNTLCLLDDLRLTAWFVGIDEQAIVPGEFALLGSWPNPFNPRTTIEFAVPNAGAVTLDLYNLQGQRVMQILDSSLPAGRHRIGLDASALSSGVYIAWLSQGEQRDSHKLLLLK